MTFGEETIKKETLYDGKILSLEKHQVRLQNGELAERELIFHGPAVGILALYDDKMILVRQFRKGIEAVSLEVPAGLVDPNEDLLLAAKREFAEETGMAGHNWQVLDGFYVTPGYNDEFIQMYVCQDVYTLEEPPAQDEDENIELVYMNFTEAKAAIASGEISDMKTIYAIQYWQLMKLQG
ncbi:NUDIX hydrolase [Aerococcaceae bacterium 50-4]